MSTMLNSIEPEQSSLLSAIDAESELLNSDQRAALQPLHGEQNVFLTGGAGTGKSYLLRHFLRGMNREKVPVLASTGVAAVLIGGRTFHSFFGLGIMEGGASSTVERAIKDKRLVRRLKRAQAFVLDEVSMIPGEVFNVAETIARLARDDSRPWGGLKVVVVGDFAQLPPVNKVGRSGQSDWAFASRAWQEGQFHLAYLQQMQRASEDPHFTECLADLRLGNVSDRVRQLLDERCQEPEESLECTMLFARKVDVDRINKARLAELDTELKCFPTEYKGDSRFTKTLMNQAPVPNTLELKLGAFVMIRQNDPMGRWVNGSLGHVQKIDNDCLEIALLNGRTAPLEKSRFTLLNAEGQEVASAKNFPINLAYAVTIHKSQGATLDRAVLDLRALWEPGQAYVALSRVRNQSSLYLRAWDERSIFADPVVVEFYSRINSKS